jgi:hypothetical protein
MEQPIPEGKPVNATVGMILALAGAVVFAGAIIFVGLAGMPGGSTGGSSPNQQQASGAPQGGSQSTLGNAGTRETTGYGAPTGARPPRE